MLRIGLKFRFNLSMRRPFLAISTTVTVIHHLFNGYFQQLLISVIGFSYEGVWSGYRPVLSAGR